MACRSVLRRLPSADDRPKTPDATPVRALTQFVLRWRCDAVRPGVSHVLRLPMADSVILATARQAQARLYSMDADIQGLPDVQLVQKAV